MVPEVSRVRGESRMIHDILELGRKYHELRRYNQELERYCSITLERLKVALKRQSIVRGRLAELTGFTYRSCAHVEKRLEETNDPINKLARRLALLQIGDSTFYVSLYIYI